jgi:L-histidine Nalpha-methyltransferase
MKTTIDPITLADFHAGFSSAQKYISTKYFYDDTGSELFEQIMQQPEYYLTNAELEILELHSGPMLREIAARSGKRSLQIAELGAGNGVKAELMLTAARDNFSSQFFAAIDISQEALDRLTERLQGQATEIQALCLDYFSGLHLLQARRTDTAHLVMFLGSNIGNYDMDGAHEFLTGVRHNLDKGDYLLIGADLMKNPEILVPAYSDSAGVTAAFNFNLLERFNRELETNFDLEGFEHEAQFNAASGAMESHLISLCDQKVFLPATATSYTLRRGERIFTERSMKYTLDDLHLMLKKSGFHALKNFHDSANYFANILAIAV